VLLNNGKVLVAGGWDFDFITFLSSAELYDPKSDIWSPAASMSTARGRPTLVVLPNGKVLAIGGDGPAVLNTVEIYDPDTNMWTAAASMGTARYGFGAVLLPDGKVLVMAGVGESGQPLDDVEIYYPDPPEGGPGGVWAQPGVTTAVKGTVTAVLLQNGSVFVAAESLDEPPAFTHAVYDLGSGTWTVTAPSLYPHSNFNATLLPSGMVLVTSGEGSELYDPKKDTWTPTSPPTGVGFYHTATLLDTGEVLVSVGNDGDAPAMLYNPSTNAWIVAGWPIHPRLLPTATRLLDGRVLMAGGAYNPDGTGGPDPVELFECAKPAECGLLP
jgi:hypothetical protein